MLMAAPEKKRNENKASPAFASSPHFAVVLLCPVPGVALVFTDLYTNLSRRVP